MYTHDVLIISFCCIYSLFVQGVARIFQGGGGSHCVKQYRHGVFATEYCRLFAEKRLRKGGSGAPQDPPRYALVVQYIYLLIQQYHIIYINKITIF